MVPPIWAGALAGLTIGLGLFLIRRACWKFIRPALLVGAIVALIIALGSFILGASLLGKSSESITAGMLLIVVVGAAILGSMFLSLFASLAQANRVGDTLGKVWTTTLIEPILVAWLIWGYHLTVVYPFQRSLSATVYEKEKEQRAKVERLKNEIPASYRNKPLGPIIERSRVREQFRSQGMSDVPALAPPDVEAKILAYDREKNLPPPRMNFGAYVAAQEDGRMFAFGSFGGWFAGAIFLPLAFRRKPLPEPTANT